MSPDRERSWWAVEPGGTFDALCFVVLCVGLLLILVLWILLVAFFVFMFRILRVDFLTFLIVLEVVWIIALDSFFDHGAVLDVARTKAFSAGKWTVLGRVVWRVCVLNAMYGWMSISKLGAKFRRRARSRSLLLHFVMRNNMGKNEHAHLPSVSNDWCQLVVLYETKLTSTERFIYNFPGYNVAEPTRQMCLR